MSMRDKLRRPRRAVVQLVALCALTLAPFTLSFSSPGRPMPSPLRFAPTSAPAAGKKVSLSTIGYGTYRIGATEEHEETLKQAILGGINVIDTSANYGNGEAEETIGKVLKELTGTGAISRDDILLVSKFGYIQGQNLARYESGEVVTPETVHYGPGIKHCIHPLFMRDQLTRSLERLQQDRLDVFLLHNPEYYLTYSIKGEATDKAVQGHREEMLRRIYQVFVALEEEVQRTGRIRSYGISSNSFSVPASDPHFLPYEGLIDLAKKAAAEVAGTTDREHSFTTIQLPANLVEREGLKGAAKWASSHGLVVLINRPINAFNSQGAYRLADYPSSEAQDPQAAKREDLMAFLQAQGPSLTPLVAAVEAVDKTAAAIPDIFAYEGMVGRRLVPVLRKGIADSGGVDDACINKLQAFLDACEQSARQRTGSAVRRELGLDIPQGKILQDYAISYLLDQPEVTTVLLGCKRPAYVKDAIDLASRYPARKDMIV